MTSSNEVVFDVDEFKQIIKEVIEDVIGDQQFVKSKVNQWSSAIVEKCLQEAISLNKPFKYVVTSMLMEKINDSGLHTANSCFWDNVTDGSCTIRWENKSMYCIVSVFGLIF